MTELDSWVTMVCSELGIDPAVAPNAVLDVARDVAHGINRAAAPVTTFLLGRAVESGVPIDRAIERINQLISGWEYNDTASEQPLTD